MAYTIGIDLGTTNTKAIVLSGSASVLFETSSTTQVTVVPTGGEMDPKRLAVDFLNLLRDVIAETAKITDEPLTGIGLTGMAEAGCMVDASGEPQSPILLWYDRRGAQEAEDLRGRYEDLLTSVSGIRMSNVATIYKLSWLKKHAPELFAAGNRWFGVPEWAAWLLTAEHYTDRTLAVRTGAYALETNDWSPEVLAVMELDACLFPPVIPVFQHKVLISPEIAAYLGVPETVRVTIAGHDDLAAAYGAGLAVGVWVDSTGTAEGLVALTSPLPDPRKTVPARMSIAPWYAPDQWALVAGVGTSGSLLADLHSRTGLSFTEIDQLAKERAAYPENALSAELTPQRLTKVSFAPGLTTEQKVSAVYDSILTNFSRRAEQISRFAALPERLIITGGHANLPELSRRKSEVLGNIPAELRPKPEAAAYGAAKLAI